MRIDRADEEVVVVTLSRRNLETLLAKLSGYPPMSAATILLRGDGNATPDLRVQAEADELHYGQRVEPPGGMHPATEAAMKRRHVRDEPALN